VAMATYNGAEFLREQLETIAAQTLLPTELVITDDASSDDTVMIIRRFAEASPFPVRLYQNPVRLGFRANFMKAIVKCSSQLIALCDQDDVWSPRKLQTMLTTFSDPEVLLSFHEAWLIDATGARLNLAMILPLENKSSPLSLWPLRNPYGFSMMFRRNLLIVSDLWVKSADNLKTDIPMAHDQWFFFLASTLGTIEYIPEPLAGYRQHGSNTYGIERPPVNLRGRIVRWLNVRSNEYKSFAVAAKVRASNLEDGLSCMDADWQIRALQAITRYHNLSRHCGWRAEVYSGGLFHRLDYWIRLVSDGAYGNSTRWTFGRKAAMVDLLCLIAPRWLLNMISRFEPQGLQNHTFTPTTMTE